ncbi:D-alanyl-D-alanine carboxypeptidase family protein [Ovoidimarina sediminis]|uniref:D-alanyl-D-alanine carboxypeptidase family protein n=1 Tax=Ovoidimarina sediminis TaxID=3079856 RepID=UPI0029069B1F|nr:D-alanyl-D-alanine carboxypeptidase family protein [Rhodophyticola sp. MJ-SS7]MDU8946184.1 D-alanyl-D-alanine carboxypeptidase family protein [Rhodophyticola sp. MJ-SS7]
MLTRFSLSAALALAALLVPALAQAFETRARAAYVYDVTTGTVLYEKDADQPLPPASMSKLMTLYMLFDALRDGRVTLDEEFTVSSRAKAMGGSTMFLNELDKPTVEDLIQGIVVSSGNDATVVVAENLAGSEDAFAREMNEMAPTLGMMNSTFTNASGWPNANHRMSTRDLGILATHLIEEFPEYYGYFAQEEYDYKERSPANRFNRNPILGAGIGADGLKTGHTEEAGYGLVGSAKQGTRRVVFVVTGLDSTTERREESIAVVNWAFRQFVEKPLLEAGTVITDAEVWMGEISQVGLVPAEDVTLLLSANTQAPSSVTVSYRGPIEAPIAEGQEIAELVVTREDLPDARIPLVADRAVERGGFLPRVRSAAAILFDKALSEAQALR